MTVITAIEPQKDPDRVNVFVDGHFAFGMSRFAALENGVVEGRELTTLELERLKTVDDVERARSAALNFLSFRPRSTREVQTYLRKRQTDPEVLAQVMEWLTDRALLDDAEFARFWVENRQTFRPRGSRALRVELRQKGLSADIVDEALDGLEGDEEPVALEAGRKKLRSYAGLNEQEFFRKMVGFLQRRGFPYATAAGVTRRLWTESMGGDQD